MYTAIGYAAQTPTSPLAPMTFERRSPRPDDVAIEILYCGVCHSDIHQARNEWGIAVYPLMPGHEIIGRVTATGEQVTAYKVGDLVGVGCMVDSCRHCEACAKDLEQYCQQGPTMTYATPDRVDGSNTMGAATPAASWSASISCCAFRPAWTCPAPRRSCAPVSPPIRRSSTTVSARGTRSASWAWAGWATWASSWPRRWAQK